MKNIRYEGLDELRALAALIIVPGHIEEFKYLFRHTALLLAPDTRKTRRHTFFCPKWISDHYFIIQRKGDI